MEFQSLVGTILLRTCERNLISFNRVIVDFERNSIIYCHFNSVSEWFPGFVFSSANSYEFYWLFWCCFSSFLVAACWMFVDKLWLTLQTQRTPAPASILNSSSAYHQSWDRENGLNVSSCTLLYKILVFGFLIFWFKI